MKQEQIFLNFWIQRITPNKKYTIKNGGEHWTWVRHNDEYQTRYSHDGLTDIGRLIQKRFRDDGKRKDIVWLKVEYKFNDIREYDGYKTYIAVPIKKDDVNKLMEDICRHQMKNCNRKVLPNISITQVDGNFKYPFGL
tara:strand:- start:125 stop:538 length:414 start_codon:yes stop_codon:yes gene_type:complete